MPRKIGGMKREEMLIAAYRERLRAERNAELQRRLCVPRTTEEMLLCIRNLAGLGVAEREEARERFNAHEPELLV